MYFRLIAWLIWLLLPSSLLPPLTPEEQIWLLQQNVYLGGGGIWKLSSSKLTGSEIRRGDREEKDGDREERDGDREEKDGDREEREGDREIEEREREGRGREREKKDGARGRSVAVGGRSISKKESRLVTIRLSETRHRRMLHVTSST